MARKKKTTRDTKPAETPTEEPVVRETFSESYLSMGLGLLVVLVVGVLLFNFFTRRGNNAGSGGENGDTAQEQTENSGAANMYTVIEGDTLWTIAESNLGSGFEWPRLAAANDITSPNQIEVGQELTLPQAAMQLPETGVDEGDEPTTEVTITEDRYTVQKGDTLWDISCQAYGDCFQWSQIAQANNLANPELIHAGNELTIPR